jgi:hypothetical protein
VAGDVGVGGEGTVLSAGDAAGGKRQGGPFGKLRARPFGRPFDKLRALLRVTGGAGLELGAVLPFGGFLGGVPPEAFEGRAMARAMRKEKV